MGTYDDSKIVTARKDKPCSHRADRHRIKAGEKYLRYAAGLMNHFPVCLECAMLRNASGALLYRCAAVEALCETPQP